MGKRLLRILLGVLLGLLLFMTILTVALQFSPVQTFVAKAVTAALSSKLKTRVEVNRLSIWFSSELHLQQFYIEDLQGDTMIFADELRVRFRLREILNKKFQVRSVELNGATVYLKRDSTGEVMNLAEVFKPFASPKQTQNEKTDKKKSAFNWELELRRVILRDTKFKYIDDKSHATIAVFIPNSNFVFDKVSLSEGLWAIRSAAILKPDVSIDLWKRTIDPDEDTLKPVHFLPEGVSIRYNNFSVTKGHFRLTDHNQDTLRPGGIDFKRLDVNDIQLMVQKGAVVQDTIWASVTKLLAADQSGFVVNNLQTDARVSVNNITLDRLKLETPNSTIGDYLQFSYSNFRDFKYFLTNVQLQAAFSESTLSLKDLNFFVRSLTKVVHNDIKISGNIRGTINNLRGRNLDVRIAKVTAFQGDVTMRGLPDIRNTFLSLRLNRLTTNYYDVLSIYPGLKLPSNLKTLGVLNYKGAIDGFVTDFVLTGKLNTAIGAAGTDLQLRYNPTTNKSFYSGALTLEDFNMGKYFNAEALLGKVSLRSTLKGGGITLESLQVELDAVFSRLELKKYNYENLKVNGNVSGKSFTGLAQIDDPHLQMDFMGEVDLSENKNPHFKFSSKVMHANLQRLNLIKQNIQLSGDVATDFSGSNPDNFVGSLLLKDMIFVRDDSILAPVNSFLVDASLLTGKEKRISVKSDFANGELKGDFSMAGLPKALTAFVKNALNPDYKSPDSLTQQNFSIQLAVTDPGDLPAVFLPALTEVSDVTIHSRFSSDKNLLSYDIIAGRVQYQNMALKSVKGKGKLEGGLFEFRNHIKYLYNGDSILLDSAVIAGSSVARDKAEFEISLGDKKRFNYANVTSKVAYQNEKFYVRIDPSDVKLGNNYWKFNNGNLTEIDGKKIVTNNLQFMSTDQLIYISSYLKNDTSTSVKVTLNNTSISDFTGIFTSKIKDIKGSLNGNFVVEDVFAKPQVYADVVGDEVQLGNELIGDVNLETRLDDVNKRINVLATVKSANKIGMYNNNIEATGYVSIDPENPVMDIAIKNGRVGLNFLNYSFFERYVKNVKGNAIVNARLAGPLKKPLLTGDVILQKDTVTVSFLNTTYHIPRHKVFLDERGFNFGDMTFFDSRGKEIKGTGRINHQSFKKFELALKVVTEDGHFLNTNEKLSPYFYGVAYGKGTVQFSGPISTPVIKAYAQTKAGTYCKLPINSSYETNKYTFYKFVNPLADTLPAPKQSNMKLSGVTFILDLDVTPDARMDIILDPIAGDVLTGYGSGNLKIEILRTGDINMYGTYEIDRGDYLFTLQNVVNKPFVMRKGGTINFTGSVYKAALNMDAVYEVRTNLTDLLADLLSTGQSGGASQNQLASAAQNRATANLYLNLTGVLEKPTIAFDIKVPDAEPTLRGYVDQQLSLLKNNENELNKQVFGLLVMRRFLPIATSTGNAIVNTSYLGGTAANTVSEFISSQLSSYLSNLLQYANVKNLDINLGYRQYDQNTPVTDPGSQPLIDTRRELQLAISQRYLNNRLSINAGGNLDFGNTPVVDNGQAQTGARAVIPTGDFQIEYSLTPDGRWRAKAFNRTNYDYYNTRNTNRTGIGLSYRQEFDKPSELLPKKKKKKTPQTAAPVQPAAPTEEVVPDDAPQGQ